MSQGPGARFGGSDGRRRVMRLGIPGPVALLGVGLMLGSGSTGPVSPPDPARVVSEPVQVTQTRVDSFPHISHEGLFPLCTGCHEGVPSGDETDYYPEPELCAGCHDGGEVDALDTPWVAPAANEVPDLLDFQHPGHSSAVSEAGDDPLDCGSCHAPPEASRMTVEPLVGQQCLTCHAHDGTEHYVDAECSSCHVTLAESRLPAGRISELPKPPAHDLEGYVLEGHGIEALDGTADCSTCHTRDLCTSCHVAGNEETLGTLEVAPSTLALPGYEVIYPSPESHARADFQLRHLESANDAGCITCHTRDDCASCHLPPLPGVASRLPEARSVQAPGVGLEVSPPGTHDSPFFMGDHSILASADEALCASCHTRPFCEACHEAPAQPVFHPTNYVTSHAADSWGATTECASCHQVQLSCRACHVQQGLTQSGAGARLGAGFHNAEPFFLLSHGQAARQSLESCASCHSQRECLQCHSETGAFQVNPHGAGFNAIREREKNPQICAACHVGNPLGGGT